MDSLTFYWVLTLIVLLVLILTTNVVVAVAVTTLIIIVRYITQDIKPVEQSAPAIKILNPSISAENSSMIDDVLSPKTVSADDRIFDASIIHGYKDKKAKEIRSHWNNDGWKKYYNYEMEIHQQENKDWWTNDDLELSQKHLVF
jgi:hypothetical protein